MRTCRLRIVGTALVAALCLVVPISACAGDRAKAADEMSVDAIVNGTHGYMPETYVEPQEPEVRAKLAKFRDLKLALMIHCGIYSQAGCHESWPLVDEEAAWSRALVDWAAGDDFKKRYIALSKSYNPVAFDPAVWADIAARDGFKYVIFTVKHHDGFCMYDSKFSDFKVTSPECPFSSSPRADMTRAVFDAFRARGMWIACYFSKPDWHHPDYWDNCGIGWRTTRMPSYDVKADPARWARFREFTRNQLLELMQGYAPIDILWLDGGQVQRKTGLDINIEEIVAEARKSNPGLIAVDRTAGGTCENVITPEQTVPPEPLEIPWESCIPLGTGFSYRFDDTYMQPRQIVHLLVDIVAKGGNLALDVAPGPDGRLPRTAVESLDGLGAWLKANGEAIYATRPAAPYREAEWAFTAKDGFVYAILLKKLSYERATKIPLECEFGEIVHLSSGVAVGAKSVKGGIMLSLPAAFRGDALADVFRIRVKEAK